MSENKQQHMERGYLILDQYYDNTHGIWKNAGPACIDATQSQLSLRYQLSMEWLYPVAEKISMELRLRMDTETSKQEAISLWRQLRYNGPNSSIVLIDLFHNSVAAVEWLNQQPKIVETPESTMDKTTQTLRYAKVHEIEFCKQVPCNKTQNGQFIYTSADGKDSFNLPYLLLEYKDFLIKKGIVKEI